MLRRPFPTPNFWLVPGSGIVCSHRVYLWDSTRRQVSAYRLAHSFIHSFPKYVWNTYMWHQIYLLLPVPLALDHCPSVGTVLWGQGPRTGGELHWKPIGASLQGALQPKPARKTEEGLCRLGWGSHALPLLNWSAAESSKPHKVCAIIIPVLLLLFSH